MKRDMVLADRDDKVSIDKQNCLVLDWAKHNMSLFGGKGIDILQSNKVLDRSSKKHDLPVPTDF